jgi:hypothetical protein
LHYIAASPTASFREKWGDFTGSSPKNRPKLSKMGQIAFGTVFAVPVAALMLADGWRAAAAWLAAVPSLPARQVRLLRGALAGALVAGTGAEAGLIGYRVAAQYRAGVPLELPGAEGVRVPPAQAAVYRRLATSLRRNCAIFISQPGLNSLYFFSGLEPPTRMNATVWMLLFDDARQAALVERLARLPGPLCAVRRQRAARPWRTPLARFIDERFVTVYQQDFFEFRLSRDGAGAGGPGSLSPAGPPGAPRS